MFSPLYHIKKSIVTRSIKQRNKVRAFDIETADLMPALPNGVSPMYNNSWYFTAHSDDGTVLVYRLAYRGDGRTEIWFYLADKSGKVYQCASDYLSDRVRAEVKAVEAGKRACFTYEDENIEFKGEFTASQSVFEFSRDVLPSVLASAVAREKWDREFRASSDLSGQVHYEQSGVITGTLTDKNNGGLRVSFTAPAVRDHSYGDRDWGHMERHFWLCAIDGKRALCYNAVRYPSLKHLKTGYYSDISGKTLNVIDGPGLEIFSPKTAQAPEKLSFSLRLENGKMIDVSLTKTREINYIMGGGAYCLIEGIGGYLIDGGNAKGIIEFGYRQ